MGLRIESQLNRLRLKFPDVAEFDGAPSHTMAVAEGMGENSLGQVPAKIADEARRILRTECMPPLYDRIPWIEEKFNWNLDGEDNSAN